MMYHLPQIRYEDLQADTDGTIRKLFKHLGRPYAPPKARAGSRAGEGVVLHGTTALWLRYCERLTALCARLSCRFPPVNS